MQIKEERHPIFKTYLLEWMEGDYVKFCKECFFMLES